MSKKKEHKYTGQNCLLRKRMRNLLVPHLQLEAIGIRRQVDWRGEKRNQSGVASTVCLKRIEDAARSAIAARGRGQGRP
jgi:hypothetical protein